MKTAYIKKDKSWGDRRPREDGGSWMNYGAQARSRLNHVTLEQSNPKLETKDHHSPGEWRGKQRGGGESGGAPELGGVASRRQCCRLGGCK